MARGLDIREGVVLGRYRIERLLGRGGMSTVYVAHDSVLGRDVALKVIDPELADDERFIARFRRESRLAAALDHPAVVPVYEAGDADGVFYIAMRLVRGRDLRAMLLASSPLDASETLALLTPVAEALDAAHALGLVHRDVKPGNILVGDDGRSFLADFGLTKSTNATTNLSRTGQLVGTVDYVPPEQVKGDLVDGRADQYSLACVLFECLTGAPPFARDSELATLWAHVEEVAPLPSALRQGLAAAFDEAIAVGLAKEPESRFPSCLQLLEHAAAGTAGDAARGPFVGLAPFDAEDAPYFFGRERLVAELTDRVSPGGFLALLGPSGSGKSSVLRAGLIPALAHRGTEPILIRPGENPMSALKDALGGSVEDVLADLRSAGIQLVVAIDPFEELFTACRDEEERVDFIAALVRAASDPSRLVTVVAVMRADYLGECAAYPALASALSGRTVLVGAMSREELARVIEGPAARAGLTVEPRLRDALLDEVAEEPGALPLLSTSLQEQWAAREGDELTVRAYERSGGVRGAVARLAEAAHARLTPAERDAARRILLRLADTGAGGQVVRRRVPLAELEADRDVNARTALAALARDRLVILDEGSVEVAHEALFREWPRLRAWLEENVEHLGVRRRLTDAATAWEAGGRDSGELLRGARLASTLDWETGGGADLNEVERAFLAASREAAQSESQRERRANRRLRLLLGLAAVLLLAAAAAFAVALVQRSSAQTAAIRADVQRLATLSRTQRELDRSILLAREAVALSDSAEARGTLLASLLRAPAAIRVFRAPVGRPLGLAAAPTGERILVWDEKGVGALVDTRSGRSVARRALTRGLFTGDGQTAILMAKREVTYIDARTGATVRTWRWPKLPARHRDVSADGRSALAVNLGGTELVAWDTRTSRVRLLLAPRPGERFLRAGFVGDGRVITVARDPRRPAILRYSIGTRGEAGPARAALGSDAQRVPAVSHDGREIAERSAEVGGVNFLDTATGKRWQASGRHAKAISGLAFSPDGRLLASAGDDGAVMLWKPQTGERVEVLTAHTGRVRAPVFGDGGAVLYTASTDGTVIAWDIAGTRRLGRQFRASNGMGVSQDGRLAVSPDGRLLAAPQRGGAAVTDARTLTRLATLRVRGRADVADVAFSTDGALLAAGSGDGAVVWRTRDWRRVGAFELPAREGSVDAHEAVVGLAFSPDGEMLAATTAFSGGSGRVVTWRLGTGRPTIRSLDGTLGEVRFTPDGGRLAVALNDPPRATEFGGFAAILDVRTLEQRYRVDVDSGYGRARALAFSPDGRLLATGGGTGEVRFFDTETGEPRGRIALAGAGWLVSLDFSADGDTLVVTGADGSPRLVDVQTRVQIGSPLRDRDLASASAAFSPSGGRLFVVAGDGRAARWDVSLAMLKAHACRVAGRALTRGEWERFLASRPYEPSCR